jgi:hypothetical protein
MEFRLSYICFDGQKSSYFDSYRYTWCWTNHDQRNWEDRTLQATAVARLAMSAATPMMRAAFPVIRRVSFNGRPFLLNPAMQSDTPTAKINPVMIPFMSGLWCAARRQLSSHALDGGHGFDPLRIVSRHREFKPA